MFALAAALARLELHRVHRWQVVSFLNVLGGGHYVAVLVGLACLPLADAREAEAALARA